MPCARVSQRWAYAWLPVAVACWAMAGVGCPRTVTSSVPDASPPAQARPAEGGDPAYVRWVGERSLLGQARRQAAQVSGSGVQWRHPYGAPQPRQVVRQASVWL